VAFHETFWVVTGTAAPVIALAAVLSANDLERETRRLIAAIDQADDDWRDQVATGIPRPVDLLAHAVHRTGRVKRLALAQMVSILFQALLLAVSLLSIAFHRNLIPAWIAVVIPVAGVWALAVTGHTQPFASDDVHKDIRQVSAGLRSTRPPTEDA
jgi:protein-S-isoprenylcysteine O-methyltransferase Ste14